MSANHTQKPSLVNKVFKKVNPFDPKGLAVDAVTAGGRPTSGISIPGIGPSIDLNHDEALAEKIRRTLPGNWGAERPQTYWKLVKEAKQLGYDGEDLVEYAKAKHLHRLGHPDFRQWRDPHAETHPNPSGPPIEKYPDGFPIKMPSSPVSDQDNGISVDGGVTGEGFPVKIPPLPQSEKGGDVEQQHSQAPTDPRAAAIIEMARSPLTDPGEAALVKPVENWTESEMKDALSHAQTGFRGWRTGDPQKALAYERVQDWHTLMYGDGEQQFDGGKPVESKALVAIPKQTAPPRTIDGQDLYQASGRIGQKVAAAAGTDGLDDAVKGLQRGLNMLGQQPMPARSPAWAPYTKQAPLAEDGAYGPKTDFALKQAIGRLGTAKVDDALALGRFNTFARQAQSTGNVDGLEQKTHAVFGPLFRAPNDTKAPKVEGGVFQETLNQIGGQRHDDWIPLKVDNWIGPKTTAAFGHLLQNEDADSITSAFGRGLGLL